MNISRGAQVALYLVALVISYCGFMWIEKMKQDYNNSPAGKIELQIQRDRLEIKRKEVENVGKRYEAANRRSEAVLPSPFPSPAAVPVSTFPKEKQEAVQKPETTTLSPGQHVTFSGPREVFLDSASVNLITAYGGDFQLRIEDSENYAWTSGYSSQTSPMDVGFFLTKFKELYGKGLGRNAIMRVKVQPGAVAEFQT